MKREEFIELLNTPSSDPEKVVEAMSDILERYPSFHLGRMLRLRSLKKLDDLSYNEELAKTAISVPDRKALYRIVMREQFRKHLESATIEDEDYPVLDSVSDKDDITEENLQKLENSILEDILAKNTSVYSLEDNLPTTEQADTKREDKETESETVRTAQPTSFYDWLDPKNTHKSDKVDSLATPSADQLIEDFIKNQPRITPRASESFSPSDITRLSVVDNEEIVTETLARIYITQKNYSKAINVYEKLSLINPEKKGYFATQIHYLKDLLNKN